MKILKALVYSAPATFLVSCASRATPVVPDMSPVGDGLRVIGFSLIGVAVVITLGRLL